jgi:hypothetical protein
MDEKFGPSVILRDKAEKQIWRAGFNPLASGPTRSLMEAGGKEVPTLALNSDRFSKYERGTCSEMDRAVLEANSNVIRGFVEVSPSGIPVPTLYFDAAKRKIIGFTVVDPENFKKMSSEELRHELMTVVLRTWFESSLTFEELKNPKDADFAFEFRGPS